MLRITTAKGDRPRVQSFPSETQVVTVQPAFSLTLRTFSITQRPINRACPQGGFETGVAHGQHEPSLF